MTTFSIVTIVYNDHLHILETMDSIINQSYKNIEYILIDGGSNDGTKEAIYDYLHTHAHITHQEKDETRIYIEAVHTDYPILTFKFLSEKDKGIYDAMNKGIALATQEWINFMNCGDRFYSLDVLEKVASENIAEYDVVYGDTEIISSFVKIIKPRNHNHKYHHKFVHQSAFVKTQLMQKLPFDTCFKIAGDTDFFTKLYHLSHHFRYLPITISSYSNLGISSSLSWQMFYEDCKIGYRYNKLFPLYLGARYLSITIPKRILVNTLNKLGFLR